jgi:chemotaxis signal transduction protein
MTLPVTSLEQRVQELKRSFDHGFSLPVSTESVETQDFLAVRIAGDPYAIRLRDLSGVVTDRRVVPLPSRRRELLGVAGVRGNPVLALSLPLFLGYPADPQSAAWLALSSAPDVVALAFPILDGFLRVPSDRVLSATETGSSPFVTELVQTAEAARRVIDANAIVASFRAGAAGPTKEQ